MFQSDSSPAAVVDAMVDLEEIWITPLLGQEQRANFRKNYMSDKIEGPEP